MIDIFNAEAYGLSCTGVCEIIPGVRSSERIMPSHYMRMRV